MENQAQPIQLAEGFNPFSDAAQQVQTQQVADGAPATQEPATVQEPVQQPEPQVEPQVQPEPQQTQTFDPNEFVRERFGFNSIEEAEQEFKKVKEFQPTEKTFEFSNDVSKNLFDAIQEGKVDDVYEILNQQKKLDRLLNSEINANLASEIIRTNIQNKYKDLTNDEVDLLFYQNYNFPQKPEQGIDELDEDFSQRLKGWQSEIDFIEKRMVIDAKVLKPDLEKLKSDIKLPDVYNFSAQEAQQREESELMQQAREVYERTLEADFKNFTGFEVTVKDEDVEIPIAFNVSEEERLALKNELSDFDADAYFENRWFKQDGTPNVRQAMQDRYLLDNWDKIARKIANEAAAQAKLAFIKNAGNVNINQKSPQGVPQQSPNAQLDSLAAWAFRS